VSVDAARIGMANRYIRGMVALMVWCRSF
jgi:hypothetical protein